MHSLDRSAAERPERWMRWSYGWYYAGIGSFLPFIALYFQQLGLSGVEIGVLMAVLPLGIALFAPAWGMLADATASHRRVLGAALLLSATMVFALCLTTSFEAILAVSLGLALFSAPIPSLLDGYSMVIVERRGLSFGELRVWGSLGYSVLAFVVGWAMGAEVGRLFLLCYGAALLLTLVTVLRLPALPLRPRSSIWRDAVPVLRQPALLVLLLTTFLVWTGASIVFTYFGIYLAALGGGAGLVGASNALGALSEMPVLFWSAWLMRRMDSRRLIVMALLLYSLRVALYTVLPTASWVLPVQLIHGFTYGAFLMGSVTLAHQLVRAELAATAQGLLTAMALGFGMIAGSLLGGALLDQWGIMTTFRCAAAVMVLALLLFVVGFRRSAEAPAVPDPSVVAP